MTGRNAAGRTTGAPHDGAPRGGMPPEGALRDGTPPSAGPERTRPPREVRVEIGELVLDGFDARIDTDRVTAAFRAELTRLVREQGVPLAAGGRDLAVETLAGLPPLPRTASPARLGEALARAVHAGLSGDGAPDAPGGPGRRPDATGRGRT
ncbi:hypothetical protein DMH02_000095 [Streptomyces sp. WAC 00631]|uniref:hypothetical protein n=1 Tax=Streptomyces sp. WAC 00631 TaxID=2203201 RepID=UPI001E2BBDA7|nr:hypothetical protein [Streptomyces sp. WAC 00631]MCC5031704.1 hypothetical protein [Streptomyces sp. WAC 00631]